MREMRDKDSMFVGVWKPPLPDVGARSRVRSSRPFSLGSPEAGYKSEQASRRLSRARKNCSALDRSQAGLDTRGHEQVLLVLVLKQVLSGAYSAKQSSAECCLAALLGLVEQRDAGKVNPAMLSHK